MGDCGIDPRRGLPARGIFQPDPAAASAARSSRRAATAAPRRSAAIPVQAAAEVALAPSERRWTRGVRKARAGAAAGLRPMMLVGLFVVGVALGFTTFVRSQPAPLAPEPPPVAVDNGTTDKVPPRSNP